MELPSLTDLALTLDFNEYPAAHYEMLDAKVGTRHPIVAPRLQSVTLELPDFGLSTVHVQVAETMDVLQLLAAFDAPLGRLTVVVPAPRRRKDWSVLFDRAQLVFLRDIETKEQFVLKGE